VGDDKLEKTLGCAKMRAILQRTAGADVDAAQEWAARLPAAYSAMLADDTLEAVLANADAEELRDRSVAADTWAAGFPQSYIACDLDSQYEATLAKADMHALQRYAHAFAPKMAVIDGLLQAYAAMAADDKLEAGLACADMTDLQARADAADMKSPTWDLGSSESLEEEQSWAAAAIPEAYSTMVKDDEFEAVLACADRRDLQCRSDATEDLMEQQLWTALDGNQSVKQQKTIDDWARQVSECSTAVPDGSESPSMTF